MNQQNAEDANRKEWTEEELRKKFQASSDIQFRSISYPTPVIHIYCDGMCDTAQISRTVLPALEESFGSASLPGDGLAELRKRLAIQSVSSEKELLASLFGGSLLLLLPATKQLFAFDMSKIPKRDPQESVTEISIKGPRDGFTEEIATNVALVRKRLQTSDLHNESFSLGTEYRTQVSLLYLSSKAPGLLVAEARSRIQGFQGEALLSSAQLEELLGDTKSSFFPLVDYVGRPDYVSQCLLRGRMAILVNGSPLALIVPSNLTEQLRSPEDLHFPYYFVAFERILRLAGLLVSVFLPGFWVALSSYNMAQLPFPLLATVGNSRIGLPLNSAMEAFLMLAMFELFREAGIRLPKAVGQTIAVVGGLIVGDAAIRAGLTSPTLLVVSAVTAVATFTLVNQSLSGTVTLLRLFVLLCSSFLGLFGYFISLFFILIYLSDKTSFGIGYLEPLAPVQWKQLLKAVLDVPKGWKNRSDRFIRHTIDEREKSES